MWRALLVATAAVAPVAVCDGGPVARVANLALQAGAVLATAAGVRRNRPAARHAWLLLWAALALVFAGNLAWTAQDLLHLPRPPSPVLLDWTFYAAFLSGTAGLFLLAGHGRGHMPWESLIDAVIVTIGVAIPVWAFLVEPRVVALGLGPGELAARLVFPVCDLIIVAMTTRLWFTAATRSPAAAMLTIAQFCLLGADILFWSRASEVAGAQFNRPAAVAWLAWFALCAAATLHPAMRDVGGNAEAARHRSGTRRRFALLLVLSLVGPLVTALGPGASGIGARVVVPAFAGLLAVLLVVRMQLINRLAGRRADELAFRATHDPLTGLGNRALLRERLREAPDGTLLLLDLDGFKLVNDTYGHPAGDRLLVTVAERLRSVVAPGDVLVRLGGDEFAVITHEPAVPSRILAALREPYAQDGLELAITTSIGALPLRGSADPLRDADLALYAAKAAGRNQVVTFEPGLRTATRLCDALRRAFAAGELTVRYERIEAEPGLYAARIGWPPHGAATLMAAAESAGLVMPIGAWLLDRACADAAAGGFSVAVPVSVLQQRDPQLFGTVLDTLRRHGLPPSALTLVPQGSGALERLRAEGVRVGLATAWHPAGNEARNAS
ncbi:diguanylate cyclase domain-containing protein [Dactylosporangium sp. CA-052675]|uniref:diguanylate cyclase domain-containing protein n=1 Tax=Dactylosporangium sp. CA-052675 TaxID=3239927 RepID=UPI003D948C17